MAGKKLTTGWAKRTFASTKVAAHFGKRAAKLALSAATGREASGEDSGGIEQLIDNLEGLKGPLMKLGQMVSYLDGAMPEQAQEKLRKLQQNVSAMEWAQVKAQLEAELGHPLPELFSEFEEEPIAAASIGQVHRAVLDTRPVAVKVQYPGMDKAMEVDLANLKRLGIVASLGNALGGRELIGELTERMREECDYSLEAAQQSYFREQLSSDPRIVIPEVMKERSSKRILTTEWIDGQDFYSFCENSTAKERNAAGETLFDTSFRTIYALSAFNGDPHPGNYRFMPDGRIALLDWGCVRVFTKEFVSQWKKTAKIILNDRRSEFDEAFFELGLVGRKGFDFDEQWKAMRYLYIPMNTPNFQFTNEYVKETWRVVLWNNSNIRKVHMPPPWLLLQRLQWGLFSILSLLNAQGDFGTSFRRWLDSPTIEGVHPYGPQFR